MNEQEIAEAVYDLIAESSPTIVYVGIVAAIVSMIFRLFFYALSRLVHWPIPRD